MRSRRDMRFPLGRSFVRSLARGAWGESISHLLQQLLLMVLELPHLRSALPGLLLSTPEGRPGCLLGHLFDERRYQQNWILVCTKMFKTRAVKVGGKGGRALEVPQSAEEPTEREGPRPTPCTHRTARAGRLASTRGGRS